MIYEVSCVRLSTIMPVCRRTLTGLLASAQAVSCCAHAGPGAWGGGETQLGTVSVVIAAEICA